MTKKRLYLGLLAASMLLLAGVIFYLWLSFSRHDLGVLRYISYVAVGVVLLALIVVVLGYAGIMLSLISAKDIKIFKKPITFTLSLLYPVVLWLGKFFRITQDKIQRSFVEVNNQLVRARQGKIPAGKLLVLLPHCLQVADCNRRVTIDTNNCLRCGRCDVGKILELCERYGVHLCIATGGTIARDAVKKLRPKAIVAVACERDLTSGILDCIPLPVLGVTNERPNGPCFNTQVSIEAVEKAILFFTQGGKVDGVFT